MRKILLISHGIDGGINRVSTDLADYIAVNHIGKCTMVRVGLISDGQQCPSDSVEKFTYALRPKGEGKLAKLFAWYAIRKAVLRDFKGSDFDVIVFSGIVPLLFLSTALTAKGTRSVFWEHGPQKTYTALKKLATAFVPVLDLIISPAPSSLTWLKTSMALRFRDALVVNNWINIDRIVQRADAVGRANQLRIVVAARLDNRQKDFVTFVRAVKIATSEYAVDVVADIFGEGPDKESITKDIEAHGLSDFVKVHGHVNDIYSRYCKYDVSALPTKWEGFGLSAVESMAARVPVISANVEGVCDVIDKDVNGMLYDGGNAQSLANAIRDFSNLPDSVRKLMGDAGADKASRLYVPAIQLNKLCVSILDGQ